MESNSGNPKFTLQNILLVVITIVLLMQLALTAVLLSLQIHQNNARTAHQDEITEIIHQYQGKNKLANDDLVADYQRDRDALAQQQIDSGEETDPQQQQIITGNDYIIYALMRLAEQDNQILDILSRTP